MKGRGQNKKGFTIVELLIVIVVIAILAVISVVAYNGIQNRAYDNAVQNDLSASMKSLELYRVDNEKYPINGANVTAMKTAGYPLAVSKSAYSLASANYLYCYDTEDSFAIVARSKSGNAYYISDEQHSPVIYPFTWAGALANTCPNVTSKTSETATATWGYMYSTDSWRDEWF